jgi:hypothetical protein
MVAVSSSCTTSRMVEGADPRDAFAELSAGDVVDVIMIDDEKRSFEYVGLDGDVVAGKVYPTMTTYEEVRIPVDEIRIVSVRKTDKLKTAAAGTVTVVVVVAIVIAYTIANMSFSF